MNTYKYPAICSFGTLKIKGCRFVTPLKGCRFETRLVVLVYIRIIVTIDTQLRYINLSFDQIHISDLILLTWALREVHGALLAPARACVNPVDLASLLKSLRHVSQGNILGGELPTFIF